MNSFSIIELMAAVTTLSVVPNYAQALTPDQVFEKVKDSVVIVKTRDTKGELKGQGSGVILPSGMIATNCHVVGDGASYQVFQGKLLAGAILYAEDNDKDICLLDAKGFSGKPAQLGTASSLKVGSAVYAVGAPQGLELSLSNGIVSQLRGGPPPLIQTTAAISPGSSGGGLFDEEGRLVGLTTLYVREAQNLNFAMPVEWIGEIKPGSKQVTQGNGQTEWLKRAIALQEEGKLKELLDWCHKWTEIEPENDEGWFSLGVAYGKLELTSEAINAYRQALSINPNHYRSLKNIGDISTNHKRFGEAIDAYRQALNINPQDASVWYNLGWVYSKNNRYKEAIDAYSQAISINPEYASAWSNIGIVYSDQNRYTEAIDALRQALQIDPESITSWNAIGAAYSWQNRHEEAIDAFLQALRINPKDTQTWYNLGLAYSTSGDKASAMETMKKLQKINPEKANELFNFIVPR